MTQKPPKPVEMPTVTNDGPPPVEMPTITNDGPPPVEMPVWPRPNPDYPDDLVAEARAAETAAQRSVCNIPKGERPAALDEALARRIEVTLAAYDGRELVRVGSKNPEVRRLEAPFSKRSVPEA